YRVPCLSALPSFPTRRSSDLEISQHPVRSMEGIRFFLNQFRKGDINDPKYRHGLVEMLVNKIYLYDDKMTVLRNTQDGHYAEHTDRKSTRLNSSHVSTSYAVF